jgi:hypothetical protein
VFGIKFFGKISIKQKLSGLTGRFFGLQKYALNPYFKMPYSKEFKKFFNSAFQANCVLY